MTKNIILNTDSYKLSHYLQYPPGTETVVSYIEARGNNSYFENPEIVHAGVRPYLMDVLSQRVTKEDVDEADDIITMHGFKFNRDGWMEIVRKHDGFLPIYLEALPEGTVVPLETPQVQMWNTDESLPWLTSYLETSVLRSVWYMSSVATISRETKKIIWKWLEKTCDDPASQIDFKLHDFGARGATSEESATLGGVSHLFNFKGTDTTSALAGARKYYGETMAGFSIPAAEHSTITSWATESQRGEVEAFKNMITQFGGDGRIYAVVSDSYDIYRAVGDYWGTELKQMIIDKGGTLVIRPDSGEPLEVILTVFDILEDKFGFTLNQKGFKVLPPYIRVIQGDGVLPHTIDRILTMLWEEGWSAENIAFGMGGALLQKVDRDTFKYAMKCNAIKINGVWRDVYKDPVTDPGKKSKRGLLSVMPDFTTKTWSEGLRENQLIKMYENGNTYNKTTLSEVRERCKLQMKSVTK